MPMEIPHPTVMDTTTEHWAPTGIGILNVTGYMGTLNKKGCSLAAKNLHSQLAIVLLTCGLAWLQESLQSPFVPIPSEHFNLHHIKYAVGTGQHHGNVAAITTTSKIVPMIS